MTIGSKSQSNDRENDLDRMEMMEDNGHEECNIDQDGGSMETAGYVLAEGKGRMLFVVVLRMIYNTWQ